MSLANIQVDVATRLGAVTKPTATGFNGIDRLLSGGLRPGTVLALTGQPGSGRTSLALMVAYMAARASAGVVFATRGLEETELVARLTARALRRAYPASEVTYGDILSGSALVNDAVRKAVSEALETVVDKVGAHLHFARVAGRDSLSTLIERSTQLFARYERVVLVVDDIEGLAVNDGGDFDGALVRTAYELRQLADQGSVVVFTALERHMERVAPAASMLVSVASQPSEDGKAVPVSLIVRKNRLGPGGTLRLNALFGASEFSDA
ncbi:MAG TPA: DnaB-like helicase C-terminal domain-containing protein [Polyangiaceae bacterium]|nr:DnaB-like helicase C-terminal domain-containing protein [Polyangiaceae bacterium]